MILLYEYMYEPVREKNKTKKTPQKNSVPS